MFWKKKPGPGERVEYRKYGNKGVPPRTNWPPKLFPNDKPPGGYLPKNVDNQTKVDSQTKRD